MPRRRAPYIKQAMHQVALEILSKPDEYGSLTSRKIVEAVKKSHLSEIDRDSDEIFDIGLMVLAGRIIAKPVDNEKIRTILNGNNIREFFLINPKPDGNEKKEIVNAFSLKPDNNYPLHRTTQKEKSARRSEEDKLDDIMKLMKDQGYGHLTIGEYLKL